MGNNQGQPQQRRRQENSKQQKTVVALKNHSNIHKDSLHVSKSRAGEYTLQFKFDANYDCLITVYLCATECRRAKSTPL